MKHHSQVPPALAHLAERLRDLEARGLMRVPPETAPSRPRAGMSFCSNDYLGLADLSPVDAPTGAGASRLIAGDHPEHHALESEAAGWLGAEAALLFTSGYAACVGLLSSVVAHGDLVVSDALNHASHVDGIRLARPRVTVVPHLDLEAVERALASRAEARAWVVVESYYSMDADSPDLGALRRLCDEHRAGLIVDEAHALGALGPEGRGLAAAAGVVPDALVGTLGKALGAQGAFVAGSALLRTWLWNRARAFVFSTGISPASAAAARRSIGLVRAQPELRDRLQQNALHLREGLAARGIAARGHGHIVPVVVGAEADALRVAAALRDDGILVHAVRPPTVPPGTSRLRLTVTAAHAPEAIDHAVARVAKALEG